MTQTLTTERLREIAERRSPSLRWGEAEQIAAELLANREAQPVAVPDYLTYLKDPIISNVLADDDNSPMANAARILAREVKFWRSQPLYTAPPAPAVLTDEQIDVVLDSHGNMAYVIADKRERLRMFAREILRAAMLAQPVSQGYKLNSPEIPDGCQWTFDEHDSKWDSGCGEAWMFCDGGPTENGVKFCQNCGKPVLLAAAPEGGNGN